MIKRNYFFSAKIMKSDNFNDGFRTMYYYITRTTWFEDSNAALDFCVDAAKSDAAEHGYTGAIIIRAFNRV